MALTPLVYGLFAQLPAFLTRFLRTPRYDERRCAIESISDSHERETSFIAAINSASADTPKCGRLHRRAGGDRTSQL
jgi:hypothetical protein